MVVVLPAPFGPSSPNISPRLTSKVMPVHGQLVLSPVAEKADRGWIDLDEVLDRYDRPVPLVHGRMDEMADIMTLCRTGKLPQDGLQDAAVTVVIDLDRRVQTGGRYELERPIALPDLDGDLSLLASAPGG